MEKYRIEVLKRSLKKGHIYFFRQILCMLKTYILGRRYCVFEFYAKQDISSTAVQFPELKISTYDKWEQIGDILKKQIQEEKKWLHWEFNDWLLKGWTLWIGTVDDNIAIVAWTRPGGNDCSDFFFPISLNWRLIWQTTTMPSFRGRGLYPAMLQHICEQFKGEGVEKIYIHCLDYNLPSIKGIQKAGFKKIGTALETKWKLRRIWYPVTKPFTQG